MAKKKKSAPGISTTAFAKKVGVSRQRVLKGIESGLLSTSLIKHKSGKRNVYRLDEKKALREWSDNIDPSKQRDVTKQSETRELSNNPKQSQYQKAKAVKEFFQAQLAKIEFEERCGRLISAEKVKAENYKIGRRVRDSLLAVPDRISAELAVMEDPRAINIYLKEQIAASLKDLGDLNHVTK